MSDELKRYEFYSCPCCTPDAYAEMCEEVGGEYVLYEDVKSLQETDARAALRQRVEDVFCEDFVEGHNGKLIMYDENRMEPILYQRFERDNDGYFVDCIMYYLDDIVDWLIKKT